MARPKRSEQGMPIDDRLKRALFDRIVERGFAETSVSDITKIVGCNRGTFYYYFKDLYELRDAVIDDSIPREIPGMIVSIFLNRDASEDGNAVGMDRDPLSSVKDDGDLFGSLMHDGIRAYSEKIEATALLLNSDIGDVVSKRIESQAIEIWSSTLGIREDEMNVNTRILLGFMVGGLLNVLALWAQGDFEDEIHEMTKPLTPDIPMAFFACLERSMPDARIAD